MARLPYVLSGTGLLLILFSWVWWCAGPTSLVWSEQRAREHAQFAAELHRLAHLEAHGAAHAHAGRDGHAKHGPADPEALAAAMKRYEASRQQLDSARRLHAVGIGLLQWSGILAALAGGVSWLLLRTRTRRL